MKEKKRRIVEILCLKYSEMYPCVLLCVQFLFCEMFLDLCCTADSICKLG